jgi:hypothetical protein
MVDRWKDLTLKTDDKRLLDATRSAWLEAGYEVFIGRSTGQLNRSTTVEARNGQH